MNIIFIRSNDLINYKKFDCCFVNFTFSVAGLVVVGSAAVVDKQLEEASNEDVTDITPT
jgi:hypothetical protein